jgi:hypothetical protein
MSLFATPFGHTGQMERIDAFSEHRRYLFGLAYRMTGSAADADDLVQELGFGGSAPLPRMS